MLTDGSKSTVSGHGPIRPTLTRATSYVLPPTSVHWLRSSCMTNETLFDQVKTGVQLATSPDFSIDVTASRERTSLNANDCGPTEPGMVEIMTARRPSSAGWSHISPLMLCASAAVDEKRKRSAINVFMRRAKRKRRSAACGSVSAAGTVV